MTYYTANITNATLTYSATNASYAGYSSQLYSYFTQPKLNFIDANGNKASIDLDLLKLVMENLQDVLCLIAENVESHKKYPVLKAAYDEYRIAHKLIKEDND